MILSWTPREYRNFIKGAQLDRIDQYEYMAKAAMANAYAQNASRAKEKKIFNKEKAIRMLEQQQSWQGAKDKDMSRIKKLKEALKSYTPEFKAKGG